MAKIKLLYTSALDSSGSLITACNAEKGGSYSCPLCSGVMVLKKSGNIGPGCKRPHFAHKALTPNCTPEGVLHHSFKMMLGKLLQKKLEMGAPFSLSFNCAYCGEKHDANLLKTTQSVEVEKDLGVCRPDIALVNKNGKVYLAIEIVVSHAPEDSTLDFYRKNGISLYQLNITSEAELENIEERAKKPDEFWFCTRPKCKDCGSYMDSKILAVERIECHRCGQPMNIGFIVSSAWLKKKHYDPITAYSFNEAERTFARQNGVVIQQRYSKTMGEYYQANVCPHCNSFIGEHFLIDYTMELFYNDETSENSSFKLIPMGQFCPKCEWGVDGARSEDEY